MNWFGNEYPMSTHQDNPGTQPGQVEEVDAGRQGYSVEFTRWPWPAGRSVVGPTSSLLPGLALALSWGCLAVAAFRARSLFESLKLHCDSRKRLANILVEPASDLPPLALQQVQQLPR